MSKRSFWVVNCPFYKFCMRLAANGMVKTTSSAAKGGHLEVLRYVKERGCTCDEEACEVAAGGGHLERLKYAPENGCAQQSITISKSQQ